MTCAQGSCAYFVGGPKLECYGTDSGKLAVEHCEAKGLFCIQGVQKVFPDFMLIAIILVHSFSMHLLLANSTSTCFKPISFLKYSNKKIFTFNRMGVQHTMLMVFVNGLTSTLMTNGLVDVGHSNGQHIYLIYLQWTFSYGVFLKTWCTKKNHELFLTFAQLFLTKLPQLVWNYAKRFVAVLLLSCIEHNGKRFKLPE